MIDRIEHLGKLVDDTTIPGERRADRVAPAHTNGYQLSKNRFILFVSMLQFRGTDDNTSAVWQLRKDGYDGPIVKEGVLVKSIDDWYPPELNGRYRCVRQYGHPTIFGVPKGARINGKRVPHENVFAVKWRKCGRVFVPEGGYIMWQTEPPEVRTATQCVEWTQFRLTDDGNDIEFIQDIRQLRQVGYETGPNVCSHPGPMNQSFVNAVPLNDDASEWADVNTIALHQDGAAREGDASDKGSRVAALRYRFNRDKRCYEYVQTGPLLGSHLFEGSIAPWKDGFVIAARQGKKAIGAAWMRVNDPFSDAPEMTVPEDVRCAAPLAIYRAADGVIRLCTGDGTVSPYKSNRDPIYLWDIDPDQCFKATDRHRIYSPREDGNPIPVEHGPLADMIKLLPHTGGRVQKLIHRVRTCAMAVKEADYPSRIRPLTEGDFEGTALYHADVHYKEEYPAQWAFE